MEIIKTDKIKQPYKTMNGEEIEATYDVYTLVTDIGFADKVVKEAQRNMRVAGFRQGKIPKPVVEKRIGVNNLYTPYLTTIWNEFCAKHRILLGHKSELVEIHSRIDGAIVFSIITIAMPITELSLKEKYDVDATDEIMRLIGTELNKTREKLSVLRPIEDRKSEHGDYVTIDFDGKINGVVDSDLAAKDAVIVIGSRMVAIPGFEQQLIDMNVNETKEFELEIPENFGDALPNNPRAKLIAGKKAIFSATIKQIQKKEYPSDDEVAKSEGKENYVEFYTELTTKAFEDLQTDKNKLANRIVDLIVADNEEPLTANLQKPIIDNRIISFLDQHREAFNKMSEDDRKKTLERIIPNITKSLYQDMVFAFLLAKADESVDPEIQDIEKEIDNITAMQAAQNPKLSKAEIKASLTQNDYYGVYRGIQRDRTFHQLASRLNMYLDKENVEYKNMLNPIVAQ